MSSNNNIIIIVNSDTFNSTTYLYGKAFFAIIVYIKNKF